MFARRRGKARSAAPMTAMGSHLDTQPQGGRYDGILGVLAGLEVLRTFQDHGFETEYDVGLVNWTNEEGARFQRSMCASGVWAGAILIAEAWNLTDLQDKSTSLRSELKRLGYLGDVPCSAAEPGIPLGAHFELHIEQGPILEQQQKLVGIVNSVQAYKWYTLKVIGRNAHTGTTPFSARKDPVLAAAKMIAAASELAKKYDALASTGVINIPTTTSINTIASEVIFTLDMRHPNDDVLEDIHQQLLNLFNEIANTDGQGVEIEFSMDFDSPAVKFHPDCVEVTRKAALKVVGKQGVLDMTSGAGHDSVFTSRHCPSSMIFVPCKDGVSHHPREYCSPENCAIGAQTLLEAVVDYDKLRTNSA